jgi:hypothetical protein
VKAYGLCARHRFRALRGLPMDWEKPALAMKRYVIVKRPNLPIAMRNGRVYLHRAVLFGQIGMCRVPCFWCGAPVSFNVSDSRAEPVVVDHRNHDRHDNSYQNLVPSCGSCNAGRTRSNPEVRTPMYERVGT